MAVAFAGEYMIYEPDVLRRMDRPGIPYVFPGRDKDWDNSELFEKWHGDQLFVRDEIKAIEDAGGIPKLTSA